MKANLLIVLLLLSIAGLITTAFGLRNSELDELTVSVPEASDQELDLDSTQPVTAPRLTLVPSTPRSIGGGTSPSEPVTPGSDLDSTPRVTAKVNSYQPLQYQAEVHPSNYGDRYSQDIYGQPVKQDWIVVLHETVGSGMSAVHHFQTPHAQDVDQASYHALIWQDGTVIYLVPPEKRAFGAGNSVFEGPNGPETVKTRPDLPPSVNNFAYHISLETPPDGRESKDPVHSGYTSAQYQSLAWLIARTGVPEHRITTHAIVDRSGNRQDPRSLDIESLRAMLATFR